MQCTAVNTPSFALRIRIMRIGEKFCFFPCQDFVESAPPPRFNCFWRLWKQLSYTEYLWTLCLALEVLKHTGFKTVKFTGFLTKSVETVLLFVPVNLWKNSYLSLQNLSKSYSPFTNQKKCFECMLLSLIWDIHIFVQSCNLHVLNEKRIIKT